MCIIMEQNDEVLNKSVGNENKNDVCEAGGIILQFLEWGELNDTKTTLLQEWESKGWGSLTLPSSEKSQALEELFSIHSAEIIQNFDNGNGANFFQGWRLIKSSQEDSQSIDQLMLEFQLHIYFATLPIRTGHYKDHTSAMKIFRRYLETCDPSLGSVSELLPYYALPYVPNPTEHPAFRNIFEQSWISELKDRLVSFLKGSLLNRPLLLSYLNRSGTHGSRKSSPNISVVTPEISVETRRNYRAVKKKLQNLQENYHKLLGVSWELLLSLESALKGNHIDLESILSACNHRYPDLFSHSLNDTQVPPSSILKESMQPIRSGISGKTTVTALDFPKIRNSIRSSPHHNVLLLLQALRQRITQVTSNGVRRSVVTSYVRNDILEIITHESPQSEPQVAQLINGNIAKFEEPTDGTEDETQTPSYKSCWDRITESLKYSESDKLGQTSARLLSTLSSFNIGRLYLTKNEEISLALVETLLEGSADSVTLDMILATLQKLSVIGDVQLWLIKKGVVEWLSHTLCLPLEMQSYALEYSTALLLNLTLRSTGRLRAAPMARSLLPALVKLLNNGPSSITPYVTGAMYSLLSYQYIKLEAIQIGLDQTLKELIQDCSSELKRQVTYLIQQLERGDPPTPPPSPPDSPRNIEDDPEWLEEELDMNDPIRPRSNELSGEDLLVQFYALHPIDAIYSRQSETEVVRSAPSHHIYQSNNHPAEHRPFSEGKVTKNLKPMSGNWSYPSDSESAYKLDPPLATKPLEERIRNPAWIETEDYIKDIIESSEVVSYSRQANRTEFDSTLSDDPTFAAPGEGNFETEINRSATDNSMGDHRIHNFNKDKARSNSKSSLLSNKIEPMPDIPNDNPVNLHQTPYSYDVTEEPRTQIEEEKTQLDVTEDIKKEFTEIYRDVKNEDSRLSRQSHHSIHVPSEYSEHTQEDYSEHAHEDYSEHTQEGYSEHTQEGSQVNISSRCSSRVLDVANVSGLVTVKQEQTVVQYDYNNIELDDQENTSVLNENPNIETHLSSTKESESSVSNDDQTAARVVSQLMGQSRSLASAAHGPNASSDPLLRSLPSPKVTEYVVAFSSRPRIPRSPPKSEIQEPSAHSVLPPISKTNHTFTRGYMC